MIDGSAHLGTVSQVVQEVIHQRLLSESRRYHRERLTEQARSSMRTLIMLAGVAFVEWSLIVYIASLT